MPQVFSDRDKEMVTVCITCTNPPEVCEAGGRKCDYTRKFGEKMPRTFIQHTSGIPERTENLRICEMLEKGRQVERESGHAPVYGNTIIGKGKLRAR